jgi:hypothetical protein
MVGESGPDVRREDFLRVLSGRQGKDKFSSGAERVVFPAEITRP